MTTFRKTIKLQHAHWAIWYGRDGWTQYHARESRRARRLACGRKIPKGVNPVWGRGGHDLASDVICQQCSAIWNRSQKK